MQNPKIQEVRELAHNVDTRINLFEGYSPKETKSYKGELLFWRQVVNLYGLFADCDRVQVRGKKNLLDLMNRYSLIERTDYNKAMKFWDDISDLRKWFCHNNDESLYYASSRQKKIKHYLNAAFILATNKPEKIEEIKQKDWDILTYDLNRKFDEYLDMLKKGLSAWKDSKYTADLLDEWVSIFANALFSDKELIQNVLADIAVYEKMNQGIYNMSVPALANSYFKQLEASGFSAKDIENELRKNPVVKRSNKDIISESIRNSYQI